VTGLRYDRYVTLPPTSEEEKEKKKKKHSMTLLFIPVVSYGIEKALHLQYFIYLFWFAAHITLVGLVPAPRLRFPLPRSDMLRLLPAA